MVMRSRYCRNTSLVPRPGVKLMAALCLSLTVVCSSGCDSPFQDWIVTVSPNAFTVAPGDSFEVMVTAEETTGASGSVELSLIERTSGGDTVIDALVPPEPNGCSPAGPLIISFALNNPESCTVTITVPEETPPGEYEIVVRGNFVADMAVDDSNPIFVTVVAP